MIPGDIYDKSIPSVEAEVLFDKFLTVLSKMNVEVLITSGNHDSNERLYLVLKYLMNLIFIL